MLSSHTLNIEKGRFDQTDRNLRICQCCNMKTIENEYHFLLVCPLYSSLRKSYFKKYYCHWSNIFKFKSIMSSNSKIKTVYNLCKYLSHTYRIRKNYLDAIEILV